MRRGSYVHNPYATVLLPACELPSFPPLHDTLPDVKEFADGDSASTSCCAGGNGCCAGNDDVGMAQLPPGFDSGAGLQIQTDIWATASPTPSVSTPHALAVSVEAPSIRSLMPRCHSSSVLQSPDDTPSHAAALKNLEASGTCTPIALVPSFGATVSNSLASSQVIAPRSSTRRRNWPTLPVDGDGLERLVTAAAVEARVAAVDVACPPGFHVGVFNKDMSEHYLVPSENVRVTRGLVKYVEHHAKYGPSMRFRFQVCHAYSGQRCGKLNECAYIHVATLPAPAQVHLNPFAPRRRGTRCQRAPAPTVSDDAAALAVAAGYPTLPAGDAIAVLPPSDGTSAAVRNAHSASEEAAVYVPSEALLRTAGSEWAQAQSKLRRECHHGSQQVQHHDVRVRHCAAFQFHRVCVQGAQCPLIHSKLPFASAPNGQ